MQHAIQLLPRIQSTTIFKSHKKRLYCKFETQTTSYNRNCAMTDFIAKQIKTK